MSKRLLFAATCGWLLIGAMTPLDVPGATSSRAATGPVEHLTATAVTVTRAGLPPTAVTLEIVIDRWSTDAERSRVLETLKHEDSNSLLALMRGLPSIGYISTPTSRGTSLRFAESRQTTNGERRIIVATERPVDGDTRRTRSRRGPDYPFSVADVRLDDSGQGEGTLAYSARLVHDRKTDAIEVEHYASEPVRLTSVRPVRAR